MKAPAITVTITECVVLTRPNVHRPHVRDRHHVPSERVAPFHAVRPLRHELEAVTVSLHPAREAHAVTVRQSVSGDDQSSLRESAWISFDRPLGLGAPSWSPACR